MAAEPPKHHTELLSLSKNLEKAAAKCRKIVRLGIPHTTTEYQQITETMDFVEKSLTAFLMNSFEDKEKNIEKYINKSDSPTLKISRGDS